MAMLRILSLSKRVLQSNLAELPRPYKLTFAITYRCQLRCSMCNIWKREPAGELTVREIRDFFRNAPFFSWINLSGGEIFLREDIDEVFDVIVSTSPDLYLLNFPTNGQATDRIVSSVGRLVRSGRVPKVMVTVSLDGPPELHDRIRSSSGAWERAVETYARLRDLRGRRFEVYLGMTLQDSNAGSCDELLASVQDRIGGVTARDLHVNVMHRSHYYGNSSCSGITDKEGIARALAGIRTARRQVLSGPVGYLERRFQSAADRYLATGGSGVPCQALAASLFLDPSGMVYPCTMHDRPVGNLRAVGLDLKRLWEDGGRQRLRNEIAAGTCPRCWTPCEAYQSILADILPFRRRTT